MRTLAESAYLNSEFGCLSELPSVGSSLENPYVYDASARELKAMASRGLVEIIDERRSSSDSDAASGGGLIRKLTFLRLR